MDNMQLIHKNKSVCDWKIVVKTGQSRWTLFLEYGWAEQRFLISVDKQDRVLSMSSVKIENNHIELKPVYSRKKQTREAVRLRSECIIDVH